MLKRIMLLAILIMLLSFGAAQAQAPAQLSFLEVDLWPEYDRPDVLVIYRIQLDSGVTLPQDLTFRIPAAAGEPHAVAYRQPGGSLLTANYSRQVEGQWALITFNATAPEIQIEYYDPEFEINGTDRHYEFSWLGEYAVDTMVVQIQQPVGANNMRIEPDLGSFEAGSDGLMYYSLEIGTLSVGDPIAVKVDYQKEDDVLSIESFDISAPIQNQPSNQVDASMTDWLPWILGGFGLVLVAGSIGWYWLSGREVQPTPKKTSRGRRSSSRTRSQTEVGHGEANHCHQCGKRAASGDRFCRVCGTKLRLE
ncbi:MAG: zinc ribbon domain-containing protein [Chloroflexota bacterium]